MCVHQLRQCALLCMMRDRVRYLPIVVNRDKSDCRYTILFKTIFKSRQHGWAIKQDHKQCVYA